MKEINDFAINGFATVNNIYTEDEVGYLLEQINQANADKETFRKSTDLFAIRQFLKEIPSALNTILNNNLKAILKQTLGNKYFVVKSIYFDKPQTSNWYVSYHQDLTISVDKKTTITGFDFWTTNKTSLQFSRHLIFCKILLLFVFTLTIQMKIMVH